jgi:hypothetical protein
LVVAALSLWTLARATSLDLWHRCGAQQSRRGHLKGIGDSQESFNAHLLPAALYLLYVPEFEAGGLGQSLLRYAVSLAIPSDVRTDVQEQCFECQAFHGIGVAGERAGNNARMERISLTPSRRDAYSNPLGDPPALPGRQPKFDISGILKAEPPT